MNSGPDQDQLIKGTFKHDTTTLDRQIMPVFAINPATRMVRNNNYDNK